MGTRNNPGLYDCYKNAQPDEPMFVLLGRDPYAAQLVRLWADARQTEGQDPPHQWIEARACADAMEAWCRALGKLPKRAVSKEKDDIVFTTVVFHGTEYTDLFALQQAINAVGQEASLR
jgi:hypothetical protein